MEKSEFPFSIDMVLHEICRPRFKRETPNANGEEEFYCPIRESTGEFNKEVNVNVFTEKWKCFRDCPDCPKNSGGVLDLYVLFFGGDRKTAYKEIDSFVNGNPITVERRKALKENIKPKKIIDKASPEVLNDTYTKFLDMLTLSDNHKADLLKRGLSEKDIETMGFRSIPQNGLEVIPKTLEKAGATLKGVPGFYYKNNKPCIATHGSGYLIPYRDTKGNIVQLQIRFDIDMNGGLSEEEKEKAKQKRYRWFTSSGEENGASAQNVPFWGLPGVEMPETVYATEGGLKAATAASLSGGYFVAIPGVTCYTAWMELLTELKKRGVKTLVDAFDSDRSENKSVANAINKLHKIAEDYGLPMKSWDWGVEYKGVDDFLLARKKEREKRNKER